MTKQDLFNRVAHATKYESTIVEAVAMSVLNELKQAMSNGEYIEFREFGSFVPVQRAQKKARNITTGETVIVPARKIIKFKPTKEIIKNLNR